MAVDAMISRSFYDANGKGFLSLHRDGSKFSLNSTTTSFTRFQNPSRVRCSGQTVIAHPFGGLPSASSHYHTSSFPSLFATFSSGKSNNLNNKEKNDELQGEHQRTMPKPPSGLLTSTSSARTNHASTSSIKPSSPVVSSQSRTKPKCRLIWSSKGVNTARPSTAGPKYGVGVVAKAETEKTNKRIKNVYEGEPKQLKTSTLDGRKSRSSHRSVTATRQADRFWKFSNKQIDDSSTSDSRASPRGHKFRSTSLMHLNSSSQIRSSAYRSRHNSLSCRFPQFTKNHLDSTKSILKENGTTMKKPHYRPWTAHKPVIKRTSILKHLEKEPKFSDSSFKNSSDWSRDSNSPLRLSNFRNKPQTSTLPRRESRVRFSEDVFDISSAIKSSDTTRPNVSAPMKKKWISKLSESDLKNDNQHSCTTETSKTSDKPFPVQQSCRCPKATECVKSTTESNLENFRESDNTNRTTDFLSSDQLAMRESIEKVQRWMKSLPRHFDSIHHVSSPVQQDY